jgi:hypothetical protein
MVYNTQNYWVSGLCPSSVILNKRKTQSFKNWMFPKRWVFYLLEFHGQSPRNPVIPKLNTSTLRKPRAPSVLNCGVYSFNLVLSRHCLLFRPTLQLKVFTGITSVNQYIVFLLQYFGFRIGDCRHKRHITETRFSSGTNCGRWHRLCSNGEKV